MTNTKNNLTLLIWKYDESKVAYKIRTLVADSYTELM